MSCIARFHLVRFPRPERSSRPMLSACERWPMRRKASRCRWPVSRETRRSAASTLCNVWNSPLFRKDRTRFTACEGMLGDASAAALAADFPSKRIYSLDGTGTRYAYCPYRYFPGESTARAADGRDRAGGRFCRPRPGEHSALLAAFHRRVNETLGRPESPGALKPEDFERLLDEAAAEALPGDGGEGLAAALREIDRRILLQWFQTYREQHQQYDEQCQACDRPPRPELFEVSFGRDLREGGRAALDGCA